MLIGLQFERANLNIPMLAGAADARQWPLVGFQLDPIHVLAMPHRDFTVQTKRSNFKLLISTRMVQVNFKFLNYDYCNPLGLNLHNNCSRLATRAVTSFIVGLLFWVVVQT